MHKLQGSVWRWLITLAVFFPATFAWCETPLSDPQFARGAGWQTAPVAATNGRDFLLVWIDGRSGADAIYATRIAANGSVLDPEGILVSAPGQRAYQPAVAWAGSSWIVAWAGDGCQFRRIDPDGGPDASPQVAFSGSCWSPRVAASGETAIIAAYEAYVGVRVATIENSWPAVRSLGKVLSGAFDLACSRSDCVLAWSSYPRKLMSRRIGPRGERFDSEDRLLATDAIGPAIAATADRFLVTWRDTAGLYGSSSHIFAQELEAQSEPAPFVVAESLQSPISDSVVSPSGRGFLVAWKQNREATDRPGLRTEDTVPIRTPQVEFHARRVRDSYQEDWAIAPSNVGYSPGAISSNGDTHLGAWIEKNNGKIAANLSRGGDSHSRVAVTRTATAQSDPYVVKCGDHLLVVWAEEVWGDGRFAVMARRFRLSGEAIDARPIAIAGSIRNQRRPVAAFDGMSYLVAWSEDRHVYARRLHGDGTLGSDLFALTSEGVAGAGPQIAATDRGFAILTTEGDDIRRRLILTRIGPGPSPERSTISEGRVQGHALGWNGSELVALWSGGGISATRLTSTGVVLDADPIRVGFGTELGVPTMACEAGQCIAAWSAWNLGVQIATIVGDQAFSFSGAFRDISDYQPPPVDRYNVAVVSDSGNFQVITSDFAGGLYTQLLRDGFFQPEVRSGPRPDGEASLAGTADGIVMVSAHPVFSPGYAGARRLFLQHLPQ